MTQAIDRSATRHTTGSQPDTDARGRDRYSERDEEMTARGFPGTFVTRDKIEAGIVARDGALTMIDPRPYASLLYDGAGMPVLSTQMLTYLAGPDPQRGAGPAAYHGIAGAQGPRRARLRYAVCALRRGALVRAYRN